MSNRQIAQAAINGRKVTFRFLFTQTSHEITGYVVGMDDYHFLLAVVLPDEAATADALITTTLVHKSAQIITLGIHDSLSEEDSQVQSQISRIGAPFWSFCLASILNREPASST